MLGKILAFLFGHQASAGNCSNYHRANVALWKKKSDELEVRLIQNNTFLGKLGDLEVRGWYFLKNNLSATSGPSDWEATQKKQCTPWKSSSTSFGDTGSNAVCTTIVGVNWWKRFHSGGFVEYPTGRGPESKIIGIRKIDIWIRKTKLLRIVLKEREG